MKDISSIKPYLIRAVYEWCVANSMTPYLTAISRQCHNLPSNLTTDRNVVLNIDPSATDKLIINDEFVQFSARFNGLSKKITIPIDAVESIFSKELRHGLSFIPGMIEETTKGATETVCRETEIPVRTEKTESLAADLKASHAKPFLKVVK